MIGSKPAPHERNFVLDHKPAAEWLRKDEKPRGVPARAKRGTRAAWRNAAARPKATEKASDDLGIARITAPSLSASTAITGTRLRSAQLFSQKA